MYAPMAAPARPPARAPNPAFFRSLPPEQGARARTDHSAHACPDGGFPHTAHTPGSRVRVVGAGCQQDNGKSEKDHVVFHLTDSLVEFVIQGVVKAFHSTRYTALQGIGGRQGRQATSLAFRPYPSGISNARRRAST